MIAENLTEAGTYTHINALGSTDNMIVGPGVLLNVVINSKGTTGDTLTLYDDLVHGTAAHAIAVIDTTSNVQVLNFNARLVRGLSATMATGVAADVTVTAQAGAAF